MVAVNWSPQTGEAWDPLSTILEMTIRIGEVELPVTAVLDTGADMTELQPPLIDQFHLDEDQYGFAAIIDEHGVIADTEPIAIATARFDDHDFLMPVHLRRSANRPRHVFGRAGLLDHFRVSMDPTACTTTFEWSELSPKNRLEQIRQLWVMDRIGKRKDWIGKKVR